MGWDFSPAKVIKFATRKPLATLERAVGRRVWIITSRGQGGRRVYSLAGAFTPTGIRDLGKGEGRAIYGPSSLLNPPMDVTGLAWFNQLKHDQSNFSFGFSRIRNGRVIRRLARILQERTLKSTTKLTNPRTIALMEGAVRRATASRYERNREARAQCIQKHGCRCAVCGFDFEERYGSIGAGFIQVHHLKQISKAAGEYRIDPITDLRPVCPNCHLMLHRGEKMLSIRQLRRILEKQRVRRAKS